MDVEQDALPTVGWRNGLPLLPKRFFLPLNSFVSIDPQLSHHSLLINNPQSSCFPSSCSSQPQPVMPEAFTGLWELMWALLQVSLAINKIFLPKLWSELNTSRVRAWLGISRVNQSGASCLSGGNLG